jgi:hypothetical protein
MPDRTNRAARVTNGQNPIGSSMSPSEIQRFETEILKGQVAPADLRALLDVAGSAVGIDPLREPLGFALLAPGRDYPLLTGSYLSDGDRENPEIMANVAAIDDVLALITIVAESEDGDMIDYWHGPERTPIGQAPIAMLDTEGTFGLMQGRNLAEAILGNYTYDSAERFAEGRAWLAGCGIAIDANNWRELSKPEASTRPDKLHDVLYQQKRTAAGSQAGE